MFTIGFKSDASRVKSFTAILAKRNTTLLANLVANRLRLEVIAQKNVQIVLLQPIARLVVMNLKKLAISTETIVQNAVAICLKPSCILVETTLQRLNVMATNAVSAVQSNYLMSTILTCQGVLRKLKEKGAITT
jgi:hypothetical protein